MNYASASGTVTDVIAQPALTVTSIAAVSPNPRNSVVSSIDVTFSEPINTSSLTSGALTLTDDGGANLINGGVSLTLRLGHDTYAIGGLIGLTTAQGEYTLTVNAADIQDQNGVAGTGSLSTSWLMDTTPPTSSVSCAAARDNLDELRRVGHRFRPGRSGWQHAIGYCLVRDLRVNGQRGHLPCATTVTPAAPSATFTAQAGHTYGFFSIATDNAGNVQTTPASAQTTSRSSIPCRFRRSQPFRPTRGTPMLRRSK